MSWEAPTWNAGGDAAADTITGDGGWNASPSGDFGAATDGNGGFGGNDNGAGFGDADGFGNNDENVDGGGGDQACFHCGEQGHRKSECPTKPAEECFNCGEVGHRRSECTEPQKSRPSNGPCRLCEEEGHVAKDCKAPRKIDRSGVPEKTVEEAWEMIVAAVKEKDVDDIKDAIQVYAKASPATTYADLEAAFRSQNVPLWLIAIDKPHKLPTFTHMDLQGNCDRKYNATYRFQDAPTRPAEREIWPKTPEENVDRLKDAGIVVDRGIPKCSNCDEFGHISKSCPQEKKMVETIKEAKCFHCDSTGHRVRDCPNPRIDKWACRNCGQSGHNAKDCTEPRSAANVECRKCGEMGHFSRDCPQSGGGDGGICRNCGGEGHKAKDCTEERKPQCRNCDEFGHMARDCPKPRDMSRVKCMNCQQMGHFKSRCPNPTVDEDAAENNASAGGFGDSGGFGESGGFDNAAPAAATAGGDDGNFGW
ncbi:hypothetical protein OQA88_13543 [Cercophora sp. LCS_1]